MLRRDLRRGSETSVNRVFFVSIDLGNHYLVLIRTPQSGRSRAAVQQWRFSLPILPTGPWGSSARTELQSPRILHRCEGIGRD